MRCVRFVEERHGRNEIHPTCPCLRLCARKQSAFNSIFNLHHWLVMFEVNNSLPSAYFCAGSRLLSGVSPIVLNWCKSSLKFVDIDRFMVFGDVFVLNCKDRTFWSNPVSVISVLSFERDRHRRRPVPHPRRKHDWCCEQLFYAWKCLARNTFIDYELQILKEYHAMFSG